MAIGALCADGIGESGSVSIAEAADGVRSACTLAGTGEGPDDTGVEDTAGDDAAAVIAGAAAAAVTGGVAVATAEGVAVAVAAGALRQQVATNAAKSVALD